MQVVRAMEFGGPEVLVPGEEPEPEPAAGQVVVDVSAVEVLFLDTQLRSGWGREYFPLEPPYVPGTGVAGTVVSVGEGAEAWWVGRRVVARTGDTGAYVQRAAVPAKEAFTVPDGVSLHAAVAALHDGPTALGRLERARIRPGERVLVGAAGGGLAAWLAPLARAAGAQVIGAARGEDKLRAAREFGVDVAVDYSENDWAERARAATDGAGVDVVFDGTGGPIGRAMFELTNDGGRFFSYGAASGDFAAIEPDEAEERRITVVGIDDKPSPAEQARLTRDALRHIANETVRPVIGQTIALDRAAEAHAAIQDRRVVGKTLLTV